MTEQLVSRSKEGGLQLHALSTTTTTTTANNFHSEQIHKEARSFRQSEDGSIMAYAAGTDLIILDAQVAPARMFCRLTVAAIDFVVSPRGGFVACFEKAPSGDGANNNEGNLSIWRIERSSLSSNAEPVNPTLITRFVHRVQNNWRPQWTADETYLARQTTNSEVHFFKCSGSFEKPAFKLVADRLTAFSISPGSYPKVAIFIREAKGQPGGVRVYLLPNTSSPVAQKMFFRADRCVLQWSPNGKHLLATTQTEVDATGVSYYGENQLYFISGDGSFDCRVSLDREGPVHDVCWSPHSNEFIAIYGYMPAKTMLLDCRCEPVYEFPVGAKNHVRWCPSARLICFGAFGNLPGHVEIWARTMAATTEKAAGMGEKKSTAAVELPFRVGHFKAPGAALCEWNGCGNMLLTAVVTPRLRVDNNFKVWSWKGLLLAENSFNELYQVEWQRVMAVGASGSVDLGGMVIAVTARLPLLDDQKKQAYVPPRLRREQTAETANANPINNANKAVTAGAATGVTAGATARVATGATRLSSSSSSTANASATISKEERQARRLKEKLDQIKILRERLAKGETLEPEQMEKISRESSIMVEYETALRAAAVVAKVKK